MAPQDDFLNEVITMMRSLEIHFMATKRMRAPPPPPLPYPHNSVIPNATGKKSSYRQTAGASPTHRLTPTRRRMRHSPNRHVCPICDMSFPWLCLLKRHMRTHVNKHLYCCKDCDYTTHDRKDFAKHVLIHTWHKPQYDDVKSEVKRRRVTRKTRKYRHDTRKSRSKERGNFKCNQCKMEFGTKGQLMRHINCVHGYPGQHRTPGEMTESGNTSSAP